MANSSTAQRPSEPVNALARQALEKIKEIDRNASAEKNEQLKALVKAKEAIGQRVAELLQQETELYKAIAQITGKPAEKSLKVKRPRANYADVLDRLVSWLQEHKGARYTYRQLEAELPEISDMSFAQLIKPAVAEGEINKEGSRGNMTYGAAEAAIPATS